MEWAEPRRWVNHGSTRAPTFSACWVKRASALWANSSHVSTYMAVSNPVLFGDC